jgi:hypothetical protein
MQKMHKPKTQTTTLTTNYKSRKKLKLIEL